MYSHNTIEKADRLAKLAKIEINGSYNGTSPKYKMLLPRSKHPNHSATQTLPNLSSSPPTILDQTNNQIVNEIATNQPKCKNNLPITNKKFLKQGAKMVKPMENTNHSCGPCITVDILVAIENATKTLGTIKASKEGKIPFTTWFPTFTTLENLSK